MCISKLFKSPKPAKMPPPPPAPSPPPTPTPVESQTQQQDLTTKRRRQLRSGLLSTMKQKGAGAFGKKPELASVTSTGKTTLG